jgi:hypothetical protein
MHNDRAKRRAAIMATKRNRQPRAKDRTTDPAASGQGKGRKDVTGKTNVYPASGPERPPSGRARIQPMGTFGGGPYEESGDSEIIPSRESLKGKTPSRCAAKK